MRLRAEYPLNKTCAVMVRRICRERNRQARHVRRRLRLPRPPHPLDRRERRLPLERLQQQRPASVLPVRRHHHRRCDSRGPAPCSHHLARIFDEKDDARQQLCAPLGCVRDHGRRYGHLLRQDRCAQTLALQGSVAGNDCVECCVRLRLATSARACTRCRCGTHDRSAVACKASTRGSAARHCSCDTDSKSRGCVSRGTRCAGTLTATAVCRHADGEPHDGGGGLVRRQEASDAAVAQAAERHRRERHHQEHLPQQQGVLRGGGGQENRVRGQPHRVRAAAAVPEGVRRAVRRHTERV